MSKHTPGTAEVRKTEKSLYVVGGPTEYGRPTICDLPTMGNGAPCEHAEADAALIAEAFNVAAETGRTPRQLADERGKLLACLKEVRSELFLKLADKHDPKTAYHWPEIQKADAAIADAEGATP